MQHRSWTATLLVILIGGVVLGACGASPPPSPPDDDTGGTTAAQADTRPTVPPSPTVTPEPTVPPSPTVTPEPTVPPSPTALAFRVAVRPPDPDHPAIAVTGEFPPGIPLPAPNFQELVSQAAGVWETIATCPLLRIDPVVEDELDRMIRDVDALRQSLDGQAYLDATYYRQIETGERLARHLNHPKAIATVVVGRFSITSSDILDIARRFPDDPCRQLQAVVDSTLTSNTTKPWLLTDPSSGIVLSLRAQPEGYGDVWNGFGIGYIVPQGETP